MGERWVVMVLIDEQDDFDAVIEAALERELRIAVSDDKPLADEIEANTIATEPGKGYIILRGFAAYGHS